MLSAAAWELAARQHGVVARWQLLELGYSIRAIEHRIAAGRLHPVRRGVYAVGRPGLTRKGGWMAAVLACGPHAALTHESASPLWKVRDRERGRIELCVPAHLRRRGPGLIVHRRSPSVVAGLTVRDGIPVTGAVQTMVDLSALISESAVEAMVNEADKHDVIDPERLRVEVEAFAGQPGAPKLRRILDRRTFVLTRSELERRFWPIARRVGLAKPLTSVKLNGWEVDFYWPHLRLVVETDGLRYHRTAAQQARDRVRDQAHQAAGDYPIRFTHAQVRYEPAYVERILGAVARNLGHKHRANVLPRGRVVEGSRALGRGEGRPRS